MESGTLESYDDYEFKRKKKLSVGLRFLKLIFFVGDVLIKVNRVVCK